MKNRFLLMLTLFCFLLSNTYRTEAEQNNLTDNYRIYEPFNLSDTKNLELTGESTFQMQLQMKINWMGYIKPIIL